MTTGAGVAAGAAGQAAARAPASGLLRLRRHPRHLGTLRQRRHARARDVRRPAQQFPPRRRGRAGARRLHPWRRQGDGAATTTASRRAARPTSCWSTGETVAEAVVDALAPRRLVVKRGRVVARDGDALIGRRRDAARPDGRRPHPADRPLGGRPRGRAAIACCANGEVVFERDRDRLRRPSTSGEGRAAHRLRRRADRPRLHRSRCARPTSTRRSSASTTSPPGARAASGRAAISRPGRYEMYTPEELAFQKRYAFAPLIRNGITTALPIASLFYREWGETVDEFAAAADAAAELGLRVYLGPAYRTGNLGRRRRRRDRLPFRRGARAARTSTRRSRSASASRARAGGLIRTMLAPDRIETCTAELLRRTAAAGRDLDVPGAPALLPVEDRIRHGGSPARHEPARMAGEASASSTSARCCRTAPSCPASSRIARPGPRSRDHPRLPARPSCIARWSRRATAT